MGLGSRAPGPTLSSMDDALETECLGGEVGILTQGSRKRRALREQARHEFEPCLMALCVRDLISLHCTVLTCEDSNVSLQGEMNRRCPAQKGTAGSCFSLPVDFI